MIQFGRHFFADEVAGGQRQVAIERIEYRPERLQQLQHFVDVPVVIRVLGGRCYTGVGAFWGAKPGRCCSQQVLSGENGGYFSVTGVVVLKPKITEISAIFMNL